MINIPAGNILLGILGTQEIIILIFIAIPVFIIVAAVKAIKKRHAQNRNTATASAAGEIEKLFALKQKGVISQQEFDNKKSALLK